MPMSPHSLGTNRRRAREMPAGVRRGPFPAFLEPSLALLSDRPPNGPQWVHEIKFDGYRIQSRIDSGKVRLLTRKALDWANRFPTIAAALELLDVHKGCSTARSCPKTSKASHSSALCRPI
jgi:bifunctional non-homologous end joining protein LigD